MFTMVYAIFSNQNGPQRLDQCSKIKKYMDGDFIYPSWDIFGAATGRIRTREPALNSTPREALFRNMYKAEPGTQWIICDYSMIEIVIMAVISGDETLLQNIEQKKDVHIFLASQVLDKSYEQLMELKQTDPSEFKKIRTPMKSVNFGLLYGMGPETLWKKLISEGYIYTETETHHIHKVWTNTYPGIAKYKERCENAIKRVTLPAPFIPSSHSVITSLRGRVARQVNTVTNTYNFPIHLCRYPQNRFAVILFSTAERFNR